MQGIILKTFSVKDKDLIVFILDDKELIKCYRFYGIRHSHLIVGNMIDFELSVQPLFLPKLHSTIQLLFPWQRDYKILKAWQDFCVLLYEHLKESSQCGEFYYSLCKQISLRLGVQDYKRVFLDAYAKLLSYEGRANYGDFCYECGAFLAEEYILAEGFLPHCKACKKSFNVSKEQMISYLQKQNSSVFEDKDIDKLYEIFSKKL